MSNPFCLSSETDYRRWRDAKLDAYPRSVPDLQVDIHDPHDLEAHEYDAILKRCRKANMALYRVAGDTVADKQAVRALGLRFGLQRLDMNLRADEDSITSIRVVPAAQDTHYIPYTDRAINWHTDGYYNLPEERVRGIVMHCVQPASAGGENRLMDPEMAYILLRDKQPGWIEALMQDDAMTIPANIENGVEIRPVQSGPVFSVDKLTGSLHMRYTTRMRHIVWKDDARLHKAIGFIRELLESDSPWIFRHRLQAGEGIICNNVLHTREAFVDEPNSARLLYRARYHDRIQGTGVQSAGDSEQSCCG